MNVLGHVRSSITSKHVESTTLDRVMETNADTANKQLIVMEVEKRNALAFEEAEDNRNSPIFTSSIGVCAVILQESISLTEDLPPSVSTVSSGSLYDSLFNWFRNLYKQLKQVTEEIDAPLFLNEITDFDQSFHHDQQKQSEEQHQEELHQEEQWSQSDNVPSNEFSHLHNCETISQPVAAKEVPFVPTVLPITHLYFHIFTLLSLLHTNRIDNSNPKFFRLYLIIAALLIIFSVLLACFLVQCHSREKQLQETSRQLNENRSMKEEIDVLHKESDTATEKANEKLFALQLEIDEIHQSRDALEQEVSNRLADIQTLRASLNNKTEEKETMAEELRAERERFKVLFNKLLGELEALMKSNFNHQKDTQKDMAEILKLNQEKNLLQNERHTLLSLLSAKDDFIINAKNQLSLLLSSLQKIEEDVSKVTQV